MVGERPKLIAQETNYSLHTVRTYIKDLKEWFIEHPEYGYHKKGSIATLIAASERYFQSVRNDRFDNKTLNSLLEHIYDATQLKFNYKKYKYFEPKHHEQGIAKLDMLWEQVYRVIQWLLHEQLCPLNMPLIVGFGSPLPHYLHARGQYELRLAFEELVVQAAHELCLEEFEAWLRCDTLTFTLMANYNDPVAAKHHLEQASPLVSAIRDPNLKALHATFQAWTDLPDITAAEHHIDQALSISSYCSADIKARIHWIEGEIAYAQGDFSKAISSLKASIRVEREVVPSFHPLGAEVRIGQCYLHLYNAKPKREYIKQAEMAFTQVIVQGKTMEIYLHEHAFATFGLAQVERFQGKKASARSNAMGALSLLRRLRICPQDQEEIQRFLTQLNG
jgi:tetratricopeptide (TPR) repeat protein